MSRRLDIEITSISGDSATWRAAGAKLPKGSVALSLLPGGTAVGTVYRAELEQYMEGAEVVSVTAPRAASPVDPRKERLEIVAPTGDKDGVITVTYAGKGKGPRRDGDDRPRRDAKGPRGPRPERKEGERGPRAERPARTGDRPARGDARGRGPARPAEPVLATIHRNALLATLAAEQLPVAEQLMRGGISSVRAAVAEQNKNAAAQGRPTVDPVTIERIAEDLLGKVNVAVWKDRAVGAISMGRTLKLRDLRAVVTAAKTIKLDEEGSAVLKELQASLTARIDHLRTQWTERLDKAVADSQVVTALELAARPPDMSTRVSSEVAAKIVAMTSAALSAEQNPTVWKQIVELAVETSIRRSIKPVGIPADEECRKVAIHNAGAIPEIAKLLGMKVPPPPPPAKRPVRRNAKPGASSTNAPAK
jgi:hypothetical protein